MARLIDLITDRNSEEALKLIPTLSSVEIQKKFSSQGFEEYTALHIAALVGLDQVVKSLIEHGADVRARDGFHRLPMHYAAETCEGVESQTKIGIIRNLHQAESFVIFDTDKDLNTPLHLAAMYGETGLVKELLTLGSASYLKNKEGLTPSELVPTVQPELAKLLRSSEMSLTLTVMRACKKLPIEQQRPFIDKLPETLLTQYVILDEPPRLAILCFNQAREQEAMQRKQAKASLVDEITDSLSKVSFGPN